MPELESDDLIITDEHTREFLTVLLGEWSAAAAQPLVSLIDKLIEERIKEAPYLLPASGYNELTEKIGIAFLDGLDVAIMSALSHALEALVDDAAAPVFAEPPKRRRRRGRMAQHSTLSIWLFGTHIIRALEPHIPRVTKSIVAVAFRAGRELYKSGEIDRLLAHYKEMAPSQRDADLRAFSLLLKNYDLTFEQLEAGARMDYKAGVLQLFEKNRKHI